jgi:GTP-binding protein
VKAEFVTSAAGAGDFPRDRLPEVAMVGRSNVGKSSLINALVKRTIARTSAAPGKTRLANYYRVQPDAGRPFYLVDLPGYGYARGGDAAAEEFRRLADSYFGRSRDSFSTSNPKMSPDPLVGALLLIDARHPGLEADLAAWEWLGTQPFPRAVVATKVDKLTRAERTRHSRQLDSLYDCPVRLVSAQTGEGLEELWKLIVKLPSPPATAR